MWKKLFKIGCKWRINTTRQFLLDAMGEQSTKQKLLEQESKYRNTSSAENEECYEGVAQ